MRNSSATTAFWGLLFTALSGWRAGLVFLGEVNLLSSFLSGLSAEVDLFLI